MQCPCEDYLSMLFLALCAAGDDRSSAFIPQGSKYIHNTYTLGPTLYVYMFIYIYIHGTYFGIHGAPGIAAICCLASGLEAHGQDRGVEATPYPIHSLTAMAGIFGLQLVVCVCIGRKCMYTIQNI